MESCISSWKQYYCLDLQNWNKRTKKSPTSFIIHLKSTTNIKCNMVHVITSRRDKEIIRTNIQENIWIFNQIRNTQAIGNKLIILPKKSLTPYHIGDVFQSPLRSEWHDSIFKPWENGNIHNIQCTIFTLPITTKYKYIQTQKIF